MPAAGSPTEDLLARLDALSQEFGESLGGTVAEIRRVWALVPATPSSDEARQALTKMQDLVHTLAGGGKSFGFPQVSSAAAPLDGLFRLVREQGKSLTREEMEQIEVLIRGLEEAICVPREAIDPATLVKPRDEAATDHRDSATVVILAREHDHHAAWVRDGLAQFGYPAQVVTSAADIPRALFQGAPGIVYADITDTDAHLGPMRRTMALSRLPLILASARTGFADRLQAVRLGATMFLAKPFEIEELVEQVTSLDEARLDRPYRVVVVEDDGPLSTFYQLTLDHAGMETRVVRHPAKLLDTLSGFDPDLILMDLYMPDCTGLDLAQIVRQFPAYTTVPILFLSTESRLDLQLKARHLGADDFLPKPLQPGQLISAVTSRANRYRDLKKLTDRDSLTGLLNHTNILRYLEREMAVANRARQPVSFAMIDIDHFKLVNDTYGHAIGDQVLLRITHLIKNRMRRVDYVGRYGGEEFAVVMPNTDAHGAQGVVDQLRLAALELEHRAEVKSFRVSFSAGVASYPEFNAPQEVIEAADAALYKAKQAGRNQVLIAEPSKAPARAVRK